MVEKAVVGAERLAFKVANRLDVLGYDHFVEPIGHIGECNQLERNAAGTRQHDRVHRVVHAL